MRTSRLHASGGGTRQGKGDDDRLTPQDIEHAAARADWRPALDEYWLRNADQDALLDAWSAARTWCEEDLEARTVIGLLEERLITGMLPGSSRVRPPAQRRPA